MARSDLDRFRAMCGQFRWLAVFMVVSVGLLIALLIFAPMLVAMRDGAPMRSGGLIAQASWMLPSLFYLYAVWTIGSAMGQLARGRLIQQTLPDALRRVGLALGLGGVVSVFVVGNLVRIVEGGRGGFLNFDVAGMTLGMIGGALFLLGRVMDQAGQVQAELDEII